MRVELDFPEEMFADLVLINGKVITVDRNDCVAEGGVAVKGELIIKVGSNKEIKKMIGKHTKVIDCTGKAVLPGFIDSHVHMASQGVRTLFMHRLDGSNATSIRDIQNLVAAEVKKAKPGEWITVLSGRTGELMDPARLAEKRKPNRYDLDSIAPGNPVEVLQVRGPFRDTVILNSYALNVGKITRDTLAPSEYGFKGEIEKDPKTGELTGCVTGDILGHLNLFAPSWGKYGLAYRSMDVTIDQIKQAILEAGKTFLANGITSATEPKVSPLEFQAYQELVRDENPLIPRICCYLICGEYSWVYWGRLQNVMEHIKGLRIERGLGNNRLKISGIKIYIDGNTGPWIAGRTAALSQDYADDPGNQGLIVLSPLMFRDRLREAWKLNMQAEMHAVGDKAIEQACNAVAFLNMEYPVKDHRYRLNHCTVWRPDLIKRVKELGIIAAPQPTYLRYGGEDAQKALGPERTKMYLPLRSLLDAGIVVSGSSDNIPHGGSGVESIWAAVTRRTETDKVLCPEQRITVMEAIRMHTYSSAYAAFEEGIKGSIEAGKLADLIILGEDPLTIDPENIKDIGVETTILGGKIVYQHV